MGVLERVSGLGPGRFACLTYAAHMSEHRETKRLLQAAARHTRGQPSLPVGACATLKSLELDQGHASMRTGAMEEPRKLYRSQTQRMIAGVCGGLAEYFNIDATLIRILFLLFAVFGGSGLVIYLVMWLIVPDASKA